MSAKHVLLCVLFLVLVACQQAPDALPTLAPVADIPTAAPDPGSSLPPTRDLTVRTSTPLPTAVSATSVPTTTPTPVDPTINITSPDDNAQLLLGSDIVARGLVQLDATQTISLTLLSANGRVLGSGTGMPNDVGWRAALSVPDQVSGSGHLRASVLAADGTALAEDTIPVTLVLDADNSDQYLALAHPVRGETAVAGFFLFFDGRARRPAGNAITISLWMNDCQDEVAKFTLSMSGSGYWQGSLGIPGNVTGPGCAIAYFGETGSPSRREAQIPITIFAADDPNAGGVQLASPLPASSTPAGQDLALAGTAFNADSVLVSVVMEDGRIVAEQSAVPDAFGNWEISVRLPFDVEGTAVVAVTARDASGAPIAETQTIITIGPPLTPTPQPPPSPTP